MVLAAVCLGWVPGGHLEGCYPMVHPLGSSICVVGPTHCWSEPRRTLAAQGGVGDHGDDCPLQVGQDHFDKVVGDSGRLMGGGGDVGVDFCVTHLKTLSVCCKTCF